MGLRVDLWSARRSGSIGRPMCTQGCQTFLWGGKGAPSYEDRACVCVCESDSWSDLNLLALPSCVPVKAHMTFGWVGVALSVATLCHAAYQLNRQVRGGPGVRISRADSSGCVSVA